MAYRCKFCGAAFDKRRQVTGHEVGKHVKSPRAKNATIRVDALSWFQIGYLAAFLDGEGGIQITQSTRKDREYTLALHPCVYFTNTNKEVIETLREWLSCGCVVKAEDPRPRRKPKFVLHVTGIKNILAFLKVLRPHMIVKTRQADRIMEFCQSRLHHYMGLDRTYDEPELALYRRLRTLNQKGVIQNANPRIAN